MTDLADANARSRIQTEFGTTFFVEAAAGTGKTTALVGRIVGLIRSGRGTLARTVAVTFTEKAAGEMKLRLRLEIERARADPTPEERTRLDRALEELELARIGTIHAFCGDLLSELWCGLSLSNFASALSVRAPRSMSVSPVSPDLDHFFLAKRGTGARWPSGDRAIELAGSR